jgi:hypothetical protein
VRSRSAARRRVTSSAGWRRDERAAYEKELDLLGDRVTALEKRLDAQPSQNALPGEAEIEQSLSIMERFMRRFMEIIEEFTTERDNAEPAPQRT